MKTCNFCLFISRIGNENFKDYVVEANRDLVCTLFVENFLFFPLIFLVISSLADESVEILEATIGLCLNIKNTYKISYLSFNPTLSRVYKSLN